MTTISSFPIFEANSVLTHEQLNSLVNHLQKQDELTRTCLIGIGVVCGLNAFIDPDTADTTIILEKGVGITSKGLLVCHHEPLTFTHVRAYTKSGDILYELLPDATQAREIVSFEDIHHSLSGFTTKNNIDPIANKATDMIAVLFIEKNKVTEDNCTGFNCDKTGTFQFATLRVLLVPKSIANGLENPYLDHYHERFKVPQLQLKRLGHDAANQVVDITGINTIEDLLLGYESVVNNGITTFDVAWATAFDIFSPILGLEDYVITSLNPTTNNNPYNQYYYDFLRHLYIAFNEFLETAYEVLYECAPSNTGFPCHLMLGELSPSSNCKPSIYRHHFLPSSIIDGQGKLMKKGRHQFFRIDAMLQAFNAQPLVADIRLTPSTSLSSDLGARAIPFYFDIENGKNPELLRFWDYQLFNRCKQDLHTSYHFLGDPNLDNPVRFPMGYSLDNKPFVRIEGHLTKLLDDVQADLKTLKQKNNVAFNVLSLSIDGNGSYNNQDCAAEQLNENYAEARSQLAYLLIELRENLDTLNLFKGQPDAALYTNRLKLKIRNLSIQLPASMDNFSLSSFKASYAELQEEFMEIVNEMLTNMVNDPIADRVNMLEGACRFKAYTQKALGFFIHQLLMVNTRKERKLGPLKFSDFALENPGMEHLSGAYQGGTFVLVYKEVEQLIKPVLLEDRQADKNEARTPNTGKELEKDIRKTVAEKTKTASLLADKSKNTASLRREIVENFGNRGAGTNPSLQKVNRVIGDFALPYLCCDPCEVKQGQLKPTLPIANVVCGVLKHDNKIVTIRLRPVHDIYNPADYELAIKSNPSYGTARIASEPYATEPGTLKPVLEFERNISAADIISDSFEYEIIDSNSGATVDSATAYVYIIGNYKIIKSGGNKDDEVIDKDPTTNKS